MIRMRQSLQGNILPGSEEEALAGRIDFDRLPRHVAVIMDGNGRWAAQRGLTRIEGHKAGSASVREIVEAAARLGIEVLSLYAFSKENWKRPRTEVTRLWRLLRNYLIKEDRLLVDNDLRLRVIGRRDDFPGLVRREIDRVEALTARNRRMTLVVALSYGGRDDIVEAARKIAADKSLKPEDIDEPAFAARLSTAGLPDPDLLIRTSGEMRVSNFLLWQIAYAELWMTPVLWPDFRRRHLFQAVLDYQARDRRFGDVKPAGSAS